MFKSYNMPLISDNHSKSPTLQSEASEKGEMDKCFFNNMQFTIA